MNEEMVRAIVRETVARRTAQPPVADSRPLSFLAHASHARYVLPESDGPCLIEPAVRCTHCGYCKSHGH